MSDELDLGPQADETGFPACRESVRKLLTEGEDTRSAARLLAINPVLRAECERLAPLIDAALQAWEPAPMRALLIAQATSRFGVPDQPADEWDALLLPYVDALSALPLSAVEQAFKGWTKSVFPRPDELKPLAVGAATSLGLARHRIRKMREHIAAHPPAKTDEERRAERAQMIADGYLNPDGTPNMTPRPKPEADDVGF